MSYQNMWKPARPFYPMPNTGTILDITAGSYIKGVRGQYILNGGVAPFWGIGALPNMFKSAIAAGAGGCLLRTFPDSSAHAHCTETTMQPPRVEMLMRNATEINIGQFKRTESLINDGRLFFTSSVDYDGTALLSNIKDFCKTRTKEHEMVELELLDPKTEKPYQYYTPVFEFWDSLSALKTKDAYEKQSEVEVGTSDTNMLAMNFNKGKSDIVEQMPDLSARHGIYTCFTAHVGQKYDLNPRAPGVRTLRWLKGDVKLKRVPENTTFYTGNFYVVSNMAPLADKGVDQFPYSPSEKDQAASDLILLTLVNQRGKYGPSNVPLPIVVSQRHGWNPSMSNFMWLRDNGKYGIIGNDQNYALQFTPDIKMRRTTVQQVFRENWVCERAALFLAEMQHMLTFRLAEFKNYFCTPEELYNGLRNKGYDWNLLLNTRFWFTTIKASGEIPYLSTFDLLRMYKDEYHPYWYPVAKEELKPLQ